MAQISREEQFDFAQQQSKAIADTAIDAIISIDSNIKVIFWNKSAENLFGYSADEIMGKNITKIIPKRFRFAHRKGVKRFLATGKSKYIGSRLELSGFKKDGSEFPLELTVSTWKVANKTFFTGIIRDISERKKEELKIKKLLNTEQQIASTLQKNLLPKKIAKIKNLKTEIFYQSATEKAQVGGDFYDVFSVSKNEYGIAMGDIAGKGVGVATETNTVKTLLRDKALSSDSPADVLEKLNNSLLKIQTEQFIAITYAIFNTETSILKIANAGNPFPYFSSINNFMEITSVPVSILENENYQTTEIKLNKGDLVIMFTDGLVEPRYDHELFGEQRIKAYIQKNQNLPLETIVKCLIKKARDFSHNKLADDMVVLGLRKL